MSERRAVSLHAWHWKVAAKYYRSRVMALEKDRLDWMRREIRYYGPLFAIAHAGNYTVEMRQAIAMKGLKK